MENFFISFKHDFIKCFIEKDRWKFIASGLGNTIKISLVAVIIGIIIGSIVAIVRSTYDREYKNMKPGIGKFLLSFFNFIFKLYVTIVRGTPVMIQLLIMFFVIFSQVRNGVPVAMLCFGVNSGAYVSEIVRGGIMGIDAGQVEACTALGLSYAQAMIHVIIPQALKSVLPALANEFIALLKETSVACYVAVVDLTKGGEIIRGATFVQAMPLFAVAIIYLLMVVILEKLVGLLERRLRASDSRS